MNLQDIPSSVGNFTKLCVLDVSENKLTEIPSSIGLLTSLRSLDLSKNRMTELPHTIGNLTNLQVLFLTSNQLKSLPTTMVHLAKLRMLAIGHNDEVHIETDKACAMHLEDNNLVLRRTWSFVTHRYFPSDLRKSIRVIFVTLSLIHPQRFKNFPMSCFLTFFPSLMHAKWSSWILLICHKIGKQNCKLAVDSIQNRIPLGMATYQHSACER